MKMHTSTFPRKNKMAKEDKLINALRELAQKGPIQSASRGSNAVGKTLQQALGIEHSTKARNSLHGYTITGTTSKASAGGRTNLFACVPNWKSSDYKSSKEIVEEFGREDLERGYYRSLFCTTNSFGPNGFGLKLKANSSYKSLKEVFTDGHLERAVVNWDIKKLEMKLLNLGDMAVVNALPVELGGKKGFHYRYLEILSEPNIEVFLELIEDGVITIDHCISIKAGSSVAREQGPLFKIRADSRDALYRTVHKIDLMNV